VLTGTWGILQEAQLLHFLACGGANQWLLSGLRMRRRQKDAVFCFPRASCQGSGAALPSDSFDCAPGVGNFLQKVRRILVYTFDRYFLEGAMATGAGASQKPTDAKLFWSGRSQAVRLPKAFRFEGDRVRVSRMGAGILLEPVRETKKETVEEWFARMDAMGADPLFPEGRKQNLAPIREYFK
jgi:antitoxin VapB